MALKFTKILLLLASVAWLSDAHSCPRCPDHWFQIGGMCYRFYGSPLKWNDALAVCRSPSGGSLVSIHSYSEDNMIFQHWKNLVGNGKGSSQAYWIGLNDQNSEGNFVWSDGSPKNYQNWRSGEPNNQKGEDCAHVKNAGNNDGERMKWNDYWCDHKQAYFCQKPLDS